MWVIILTNPAIYRRVSQKRLWSPNIKRYQKVNLLVSATKIPTRQPVIKGHFPSFLEGVFL
jgi:hypothetical protein